MKQSHAFSKNKKVKQRIKKKLKMTLIFCAGITWLCTPITIKYLVVLCL